VREEQRAKIPWPDARRGERAPERRQRARRPGVDERDAARIVEHRGGDDSGNVLEMEIGERDAGGECLHRGIIAPVR
jgi:hypothetical protein